MCGITGWTDTERDLTAPEHRATAAAMTATMACRGPDADGVWTSPHAVLGHRRLSIIDLDGGRQPMTDTEHDPDVVLTYSGEVYNFAELRAELATRGHRFRTRSDTEVVLRAYLEWGADLAPRLNGMYAFAIWDARSRELLLIRDRLGVKPLYYHVYPGGVLFGSEPKAILANPLFEAALDDSGIAELFALPTAPTPGHAVYAGLRQVRAGHVVRADARGVTESAYWRPPALAHTDNLDATAAHVRELLRDTVTRQLVADVPLGSLLSGGVDSSAVSALAAEALGRDGAKLDTYSVDFPGADTGFRRTAWHDSRDEPYARAVAAHLGTRHTTIVVDPDDVRRHEEDVLRARDLPGWGEMDVSLHLLFAHVRRHSTVALSGESADEVFGGYPYFRDPAALGHDGFPWLYDRDTPASLLRPEVRERVRPAEYARARYEQALAEVPRLPGERGADVRVRDRTALLGTGTARAPARPGRDDRPCARPPGGDRHPSTRRRRTPVHPAVRRPRLLRDHRARPPRSFSVGFTDASGRAAETEDDPYVRLAAAHLGSEHRDIVLDGTRLAAPEVREACVRARDLPLGIGDLDLSLHQLFAAIRTHSTVALSGESADEVFGGYRWFHHPEAVHADTFPWMADSPAHGRLHQRILALFRKDVRERFAVEDYVADQYRTALDEVRHHDGAAALEHRMDEIGHLALTRFLPTLLDRKYRLSMAVGLEVRVPFCDHRLVEYVHNIPWSMRTHDGREKSVLRAAVADLLPEAVLYRPKSPYPSTPDPAYSQALRGQLAARLAEPDCRLPELFDDAALHDAVTVSEQGSLISNVGAELALNFDVWLRAYDPVLPL